MGVYNKEDFERDIWAGKPKLSIAHDGGIILTHGRKTESISPEVLSGRRVLIGCTVVSFDALFEIVNRVMKAR
jgi:hypothetical protein